MEPLSADILAQGAMWLVVFLFSTTCHEAAHAWAAHRLGDSTAYHGGQVSLNPIPHIRREPVGMIVVPILSFLFVRWTMGWASAPYDPTWAQRHPRRAALMALAGPAANLCLVVLAGIGIRVGMATGHLAAPDQIADYAYIVSAPAEGMAGGLAAILSITFFLNLLLFTFNLVPVPPLDGSSVITLAMNEDTARRYQLFVWSNPMLAWAGILIAWRVFGHVYRPLYFLGLKMLYPELSYSFV